MRNFFLFLSRFRAFFLFLLLELFCFILIFNYNQYQKAAFLNSSNAVTGGIYDEYNEWLDYLRLQRINDSLMEENAALRAKLGQSLHLDTALEYCLEDSLIGQLYTYFPSRVVHATTTRANNYLTIDKGYEHGVRKNMGLISSNGIVGVIEHVSDNYAVAMSVLHRKFQLSARLARDNVYGRLIWDGKDPNLVQLTDIPRHVKPLIGDAVLTTGFSSIFPEGILIGKVVDFHAARESNFMEVNVRLSQDLNRIHYAYVVNYLQKSEKDSLELEAGVD